MAAAASAAVAGLAGYAAYSWANSDPEGFHFEPSSLEMQTDAHSSIPACRVSKHHLTDDEKIPTSLYVMFTEAVEKYSDKKCLGWRSSTETGFDTWLTYSETLERVTNIGHGLRWLGQKPGGDTLIGMFSKNKAEMVMTQLACYQHSMVMVPMYDTLGEEGIEHIVNQTQMQVVICDDEDKIKLLLNWGKEKLPSITTVAHFNSISVETTQRVQEQDWKLHSFSEIESEGEKNPVEQHLCKPEDLCVICYTSGTTGKPKGAMIEHRGIQQVCLCALSGYGRELRCGEDFYTDDETYLSYLPLAHMYEQVMVIGLLSRGSKIGFYSGDVKELLNDIKYLRPTFFASVPRLLNRIHDKVIAALSQSPVKNWLFQMALNKKEEYFKRGIITKSTIWDKLVFKKIQDLLGGRVKGIITGAAPISPPVLRFLRLAFGATVMEGYGQTESSAAMTTSAIGEYKFAEVGVPFGCNIIKLVDVPDMNYYAADNVGEVCGYGVNVFRGYYKDEAKTKEAIDSQGWLHTGDIGMWTERGTLKIVDRKKNIFKLSQGEYIAPEKIENVYANSTLVAQCYVHGDSLQSAIVGIVVPDADVLPTYAKSKLGLSTSDMKELCRNEKVKEAIMQDMRRVGKESNLKGFEQVKAIHLTDEPFSVENGLLTPTFKLKRTDSRKKYQAELAELCSKI